jgi:hypothetical protein
MNHVKSLDGLRGLQSRLSSFFTSAFRGRLSRSTDFLRSLGWPITSILLREKDARPVIIYAASSRADCARLFENNRKMTSMSDFGATSPRKVASMIRRHFSTVAASRRSFESCPGRIQYRIARRLGIRMYDDHHRSSKLEFKACGGDTVRPR